MSISYEKDIMDLLLEVFETGFKRIELRHLYRWYGVARITNRVWDDLKARFAEIDADRGNKGWRLGYLNWDMGEFLVLICLDSEGTSPEDSSFQPIDGLKSERSVRVPTKKSES